MRNVKVHALVHPDYLKTAYKPIHRRGETNPVNADQLAYQEQWEQRVHAIAQNPNAVLLYFSYLPGVDLGLTANATRRMSSLSYVSDEVREDAQARIKRYQEILDDRFILFTKDDGWPPLEVINARLDSEHQLEVGSIDTLNVFGVTRENCVFAWGDHLQEILQPQQYTVEDELSIPLQEELRMREYERLRV